MQTWMDGVLEIPCLSLVRVREVANVAVETRIAKVGLETLERGGIVAFAVAVEDGRDIGSTPGPRVTLRQGLSAPVL